MMHNMATKFNSETESLAVLLSTKLFFCEKIWHIKYAGNKELCSKLSEK